MKINKPLFIEVDTYRYYEHCGPNFDDNLNYLFFVDFFTILILVDVFILLISFQYTERYSQLIRNTGFIISTILLRLSFSATGLVSIILLVSGIIFGIIILAIYNQMEKQSIKV